MSLAKLKEKIAAQRAGHRPTPTPEGIQPNRKRTDAVVARPEPVRAAPSPIIVPGAQPASNPMILGTNGRPLQRPMPPAPPSEAQGVQSRPTPPSPVQASEVPMLPPRPSPLSFAQKEALLKGGYNVLAVPLPPGYMALGKNDVEALMWCKEEILKHGVMAFDYETDGDPDDETTDPQDHKLVSVSFTWKIGFAVVLPLAHDSYGANWDWEWLRDNFLKELLEHPDVFLIAHNVKAEYQWSLTHGIDFFHKALLRKVMDTMLMVKALALPENTEYNGESYEVMVGLKPSTKALLADEHGMIHGLLHVDDIKSFKETVGKHHWEEHLWDESMGYYKSGAKKGQKKVKVIKHSRSRTFNELPVDKTTVDYGASDSDWSLGIFGKLLPLCEAEGIMDVLYELDIPRMLVLAEYELAGWHVSRDRLFELQKVANKALWGDPDAETEEGRRGLNYLLNEALMELIPIANIVHDDETGWNTVEVPAGVYPMGEWRRQPVTLEMKTPKPFNWGSWQHKTWLFYYVLQFPMAGVERSKNTGLPTTNGKQVERFIESYEGDSKFMNLLKEKSKYDKINSTYVDGMLPFCRADADTLHTSLGLVSTWRLSSKKPNLQNIPRPDNDPMGIRGVFVAPFFDPSGKMWLPEKKLVDQDGKELTSEARLITPDDMNPWTAKVWHFIVQHKLSGHVFYIGADYSQIELKVLAWFARELEMIKVLASGGDLHAWAAHKVFKLACDVSEVKEKFKPHRYRAKKVNFGLVYGMTEYGLSSDPQMGMTVEQAKAFIEDYMNTFPGVRQYAHDMIAFGRQYGYVETMFRHRRPVPHINDSNKWVRQRAENICMNTPIQGSAADIIANAMVNIRREQHLCPQLSMHMQIHDELQGQAPVEYVVGAARFMQDVMERPIEGFSDIMPIVAEPAVGATWDTALDLKWDEHGNPYVKPKKTKKEATDVTYEDIAPYEHMYHLAGIKIA